jgi:putative transposase
MPRYLRAHNPGGTFFFTVVTLGRRRIFREIKYVRSLMAAMLQVQREHPFTMDAVVVLPVHLHALWTLPEGDGNYGKRWGLVKALFSKAVKEDVPGTAEINLSRMQRRESHVWQRRFWEHAIRDEPDFQKHLDYIHYNPLKLGLVRRVRDWPYSSFHRFVKEGIYPEDWGGEISFPERDIFGE